MDSVRAILNSREQTAPKNHVQITAMTAGGVLKDNVCVTPNSGDQTALKNRVPTTATNGDSV